MNEFESYLQSSKIQSIKKVNFQNLVDFTAEFNTPSIHVTKSRVWTLRQFYHFLALHRIVPENIATGLPYPKIEKTIPQFLTNDESPKKKLAPLFPGQPDTAISKSRVQRIVKDRAVKAGIVPVVTPRMLRHSFATEMYHCGVPLSDLQVMMGHASIADTSIYVHVSDKLKQLALDSIFISRRCSWQ